jgi:hypothetical protein
MEYKIQKDLEAKNDPTVKFNEPSDLEVKPAQTNEQQDFSKPFNEVLQMDSRPGLGSNVEF